MTSLRAPEPVRPAPLAAVSWHVFSALAVGLVTAGLTGSPGWGAAAAAGDLILRPQLQMLHDHMIGRLLRRDSGR